jgi:hypothetical protein
VVAATSGVRPAAGGASGIRSSGIRERLVGEAEGVVREVAELCMEFRNGLDHVEDVQRLSGNDPVPELGCRSSSIRTGGPGAAASGTRHLVPR